MRRDRLLRPHQQPWLHPAVYLPIEQRVDAARAAIEEQAAARSLAECLLTFGGDHGFHFECRFLRDLLGDWVYELDCDACPLQSHAISDTEIRPVCDRVLDLHGAVNPDENGYTLGCEASACLSVLWYSHPRQRLVWVRADVAVQEGLIAVLKQVHRRLDLQFPPA